MRKGPPWELYGSCGFCGAKPGHPCIHMRTAANLSAKQRRMGGSWTPPPLAQPHPGRPRFKIPVRTAPRRSRACPHWEPSGPPRLWMCGRLEHPDPYHVHASNQYGVIHWSATQQRNLPDYTPRHLREED